MLAAKDSHETAATQFVQSEATAWRLWSFAHAAMEPMNCTVPLFKRNHERSSRHKPTQYFACRNNTRRSNRTARNYLGCADAAPGKM
jgi:hypothetical protein